MSRVWPEVSIEFVQLYEKSEKIGAKQAARIRKWRQLLTKLSREKERKN